MVDFVLRYLESNQTGAEEVIFARAFSAVRGGAGGSPRLASAAAAMSKWAAKRGSKDDISVAIVSLATKSGLGPESQLEPEPEPKVWTASTVHTGPSSTILEVVRAERGGESTEEWLGEQVTLPCAAQEITSSAHRKQRWHWEGITLDTILRPATDSGSLAQFLVEMYGVSVYDSRSRTVYRLYIVPVHYSIRLRVGILRCSRVCVLANARVSFAYVAVEGEGYLLRGRLSHHGTTITLIRNEKPNGPYPSPTPKDWDFNVSRIVFRVKSDDEARGLFHPDT